MALFSKHAVLPDNRAATLESVRERSCYSALRGLVNFCFSIFTAVCSLGVLAGVIVAVKTPDIYRTPAPPDPIVGIVGAVASALLICIAVAARQAAFLLIDLADLAIADRADRQPTLEP